MVRHDHVILVPNQHAHIIFDSDVVSEHVAVSDVTIILLIVDVKFLQGVVDRHVKGEGIFLCFFGSVSPFVVLSTGAGLSDERSGKETMTNLCPTVLLSVLLAIERSLTHPDNLLGRAVYPPVDLTNGFSSLIFRNRPIVTYQVKVMAGFVDHQST